MISSQLWDGCQSSRKQPRRPSADRHRRHVTHPWTTSTFIAGARYDAVALTTNATYVLSNAASHAGVLLYLPKSDAGRRSAWDV